MDVIVVRDADRAGVVAAEVVAGELTAAGRRRDEDGSRPVARPDSRGRTPRRPVGVP